MMLLILLASWSVLPSGGDGPLVCNPAFGHRYISTGTAGGISASGCSASWDLHEVKAFTSSGQLTLFASSSSGSDSSHLPGKAVDGDTSTFWAGDHDVGMSCSCWESSKKDGQDTDDRPGQQSEGNTAEAVPGRQWRTAMKPWPSHQPWSNLLR